MILRVIASFQLDNIQYLLLQNLSLLHNESFE
jgi:hypothetical protein